MDYYFGAFLPVVEGGYAIFFPDFPEVASQGDDLAECMEMAADALRIVVEEYAKTRKALPIASSAEQAQAFADKEMEGGPGIDTSRKALVQLFAVPDLDMIPVRINVSFPKRTLSLIDQTAARLGMTRSGFLALAAKSFNGEPASA